MGRSKSHIFKHLLYPTCALSLPFNCIRLLVCLIQLVLPRIFVGTVPKIQAEYVCLFCFLLHFNHTRAWIQIKSFARFLSGSRIFKNIFIIFRPTSTIPEPVRLLPLCWSLEAILQQIELYYVKG